MPDDRSRAEVSRRGTCRSRSISTDCSRSRGHDSYSPPHVLAALAVAMVSVATDTLEQVRYYQGIPRSHREHLLSYDHLRFPYADMDLHWLRTGPRDHSLSREPSQDTADRSRPQEPFSGPDQYGESTHQVWAAYTGPGPHTLIPGPPTVPTQRYTPPRGTT